MPAKLSIELQRHFLSEECADQVSLASVLDLAGERVFGFLFVLLALPSALPVPAPGYSIPFGILLLILAVQLIIGRQRPWFPKKWLNRQIPREKVQGFIQAGLSWLQKIELISRPRLTTVCTSFIGRVVIGCVIALMAISMMIPIPGTNTLPAMGIFITGFGLLDDDGAISLVGIIVCLMGFTLSLFILIFGYEAVKGGINFIRQTL